MKKERILFNWFKSLIMRVNLAVFQTEAILSHLPGTEYQKFFHWLNLSQVLKILSFWVFFWTLPTRIPIVDIPYFLHFYLNR